MIVIQQELHSERYLPIAWHFTSNLKCFPLTNSIFSHNDCLFSVTKAHIALDDDDYGATKFTTASVTNAPTHTVSSSETIWCFFSIIRKILSQHFTLQGGLNQLSEARKILAKSKQNCNVSKLSLKELFICPGFNWVCLLLFFFFLGGV